MVEPEFDLEVTIDDIYDRFSSDGMYPSNGIEDVVRDLTDNAENLESDWYDFEEQGYNRFTDLGSFPINIESATDLEAGEPLVCNTWHTEKKQPWPTATGRLHFYLDHDWYLELGEEFPWHKDSIKAGGDYPLQMTGGHSRWSIHTMWAEHPTMLALQRGEPIMLIGVEDAAARGLADGDRVEVFNDVGRFEIQAVVSKAVRPGQVIVYHQWENFQFKDWRQFQQVMPTPFNPVEFAPAGSEYPNLRPMWFTGYPGFSDRDTRVEVRKAEAT